MKPRTNLLLNIVSLSLLTIFLTSGTSGSATSSVLAYECEGNACSQVTLVWENDSQQFKAQNNSDNRVKIDVTTFAGDSTIHVDAHKSEYLLVKSFNGPYRANFE